MSNTDVETLTKAIQRNWPFEPGDKTRAYIGKFSDRVRMGTRIVARVVGNHGTYTVSIQVSPQFAVTSACSCYIGKGGNCHHCAALAKTFLYAPDSFIEKAPKKLETVKGLEDVFAYLENVTLESLLIRLKEKGITQKAFAASIGMSTQHLSAVKSSELNNRVYHELGATKLACLWVLEHHGDDKDENKSVM